MILPHDLHPTTTSTGITTIDNIVVVLRMEHNTIKGWARLITDLEVEALPKSSPTA